MVKNNKGTILVIAVVAMSIMIIIGFICLRIYSNQSILDTRDVVKQRLYYSAIGSVEAMKGFLSEKIAENVQSRKGKQNSAGILIEQGDVTSGGSNEGFLANVTNNSTRTYEPFKWVSDSNTGLFGTDKAGVHNVFDGSMHPSIVTSVKLIRLTTSQLPTGTLYFSPTLSNNFNGVENAATAQRKAYVIEAKTTATFKTSLNSIENMEFYARYYFCTIKEGSGTETDPYKHTIHCIGWRID